MNAAWMVLRYVLRDVARGRWVLLYAAFFGVLTFGLVAFGGSGSRALLSLVNVVLFLIPLVGLLFGTIYLYNARAFIELLLTQPVARTALYAGLYGGLTLPLAGAFLIGTSLPFAFTGLEAAALRPLLVLLGVGVLLTLIFGALAFVITTVFLDRVKGLGMALLVWIGATLLYDGLVLLLLNLFSDYPLEVPTLVLMLLNPVDLARVLLLLQFDISALMGYTGAVFARFFGHMLGLVVALGVLVCWIVGPYWFGRRRFGQMDF
jgi:Cu-processing system permease protein